MLTARQPALRRQIFRLEIDGNYGLVLPEAGVAGKQLTQSVGRSMAEVPPPSKSVLDAAIGVTASPIK
jgi:hypothetical protein